MTDSRIHRPAHRDHAGFGWRSWWRACAVVLLLWAPVHAGVAAPPSLAGDTAIARPAPPATVTPDLPVHQMVWKQWTVSEGLPQITINEILQDPKGYLWVAMQEGVARFDGLHFEHFTVTEHPGLGHGFVTALGLDAEGGLWAGSLGGIARYAEGRWHTVPIEGWPRGIGQVLSIHPHPQDGTWVTSDRGLFHARAERARRIPIGLDGLRVVSVLPAVRDQPEVVVTHRHLVFDPLGARRLVTLAEGIPDVLVARRDEAGGLWLGTAAGLVHTDDQGRMQRLWAPGRQIEDLQADYDGSLWLATDRGLWRLDPVAGAQPLDVPGLTDVEDVRRVFVDRERTLWVGTQLGGLYRAWPDRFRRITRRDGLIDEAVWTIYEAPDGEMWAGTQKGLFRGGLGGFRQVADEKVLPHPTVFSTLVDRQGALWTGTARGLIRRPPGATAWRRVEALQDQPVTTLLEEANGDVLI